jgi:ketosteroid isomerase-like protein
MNDTHIRDLLSRHLRAEGLGDVDGAIAVYADDIEHDVVGFPGSPHHGKDGARKFYEELTANFRRRDDASLRH